MAVDLVGDAAGVTHRSVRSAAGSAIRSSGMKPSWVTSGVQRGVQQPGDRHPEPAASFGQGEQVVAAGHRLGRQARQSDAKRSGDRIAAAQVNHQA